MSATVRIIPLIALACSPPPGGGRDGGSADVEAPGVDWATARARLGADARPFRAVAAGAFEAGMPGHLRARLDADGAVLGHGADTLELSLVGWGRTEAWWAAAPASPRLGRCADASAAHGGCVRRVEQARSGLTEWWVGRPHGLQQGWTVHERPAGDGPLTVEVSIPGGDAVLHGDDVLIVSADGSMWRYGDVAAWDAQGDPRPARLVADGDRVRIEVDDAGATYPLVIDPTASVEQAELVATTPTVGADFGYDLSEAGDIDGDGYDDVIVGEHQNSDLGTYAGAAYVYYGSSTGLDPTRHDQILASDGASYDWFGVSVAGAGDLDGDGYDDVIVGAYGEDDGGSNAGAAYVYYGSSGGIDLASEDKITAFDADVDFRFGVSVAGVGDMDGDGYDDLAIGSVGRDNFGALVKESVYLYDGGASGVDIASGYEIAGTPNDDWVFGTEVFGAGDVDGDGLDDLLVGANAPAFSPPRETGAAYVYLGGATPTLNVGLTTATSAGDDAFGYTLGPAGDVNADGYADIVVGAYLHEGSTVEEGQVTVYYGSSTGISSSSSDSFTASDNTGRLRFGEDVDGAGDLDGDGYDDIVVGAPDDDTLGGAAGAAYVYYGSAGGIDVGSEEKRFASDGDGGDAFGEQVSGAGDVDGDGYDDLLIGALQGDADAVTDAGTAYTFLGHPDDEDGDGVPFAEDCDPLDPYVGAGTTQYLDGDGDGYGDPGTATTVCPGVSGYVATDGDCDDGDANVFPGATEVPGDAIDQDCDGTGLCYVDNDLDGARDGSATLVGSLTCTDPGEALSVAPVDCFDSDAAWSQADEDGDGLTTCAGDCDDLDAFIGTCPGYLALTDASNPYAGQSATWELSGAAPNAQVHLLFGRPGGPLMVPGCPGLSVPLTGQTVVQSATADAAGEVSFTLTLPAGAAGATRAVVALDPTSCMASEMRPQTFY